MTWHFDPLPRQHYSVVEIDPPWRYSMGTKSRPQHYDRMSLEGIKALPVRDLLKPEGGRVFLWITTPLLHRIGEISDAWRLRYSSAMPWLKVRKHHPGAVYSVNDFVRGTGFEVTGNCEMVVILKAGSPETTKGRPFPPMIIAPRREHSRKPPNLKDRIERRFHGPYAEIFARSSRAGWDSWGNETQKFDGEAA